jgi:hypothetical protein
MLNRRTLPPCLLALFLLPCAVPAQTPARPAAEPRPAATPRPAAEPGTVSAPALTDKDVANTQRQLIELLRLSPTLTTVVSHDPTLLSDQAYVSRENPQLADFLIAHPEVARNPEFYLFTHMNPQDGGRDEALEREVWPEVYRMRPQESPFNELAHDFIPWLAFATFLAALLWAIRVFVENRRWSRIFKLQSEVHGKLIDKFSTSQELAAYMETDAGKRFLEAAPIPLSLENGPRMPNAVARVLTPIQIGTVLILLGIGFLLLRHAGPDFEIPMRVLGVLILMPGIGFILSAAFTWALATRLGLMPPPGSQMPFDHRP